MGPLNNVAIRKGNSYLQDDGTWGALRSAKRFTPEAADEVGKLLEKQGFVYSDALSIREFKTLVHGWLITAGYAQCSDCKTWVSSTDLCHQKCSKCSKLGEIYLPEGLERNIRICRLKYAGWTIEEIIANFGLDAAYIYEITKDIPRRVIPWRVEIALPLYLERDIKICRLKYAGWSIEKLAAKFSLNEAYIYEITKEIPVMQKSEN